MTVLTNDALLAVADRAGVQTLPLALAVGPQQDSFEEWQRAQESAVATLIDDGLIDAHGEVDPELADVLFTLAHPEQELAARIYTGNGSRRVCVVRRAHMHAVAVRSGDDFDVRPVWTDGSAADLVRPVLAAMDACPPAEIPNFSVPAAELAERLDGAATSSELTDALYALGATDRDATTLGLTFGATHAYAEIVACAHEDGVTTRAPGAVAVYDTARGRIVAAPMVSPDQQVWSTVTPGTDHRVAQAVATLIEGLPGGRWLPQ
ncbi:ESX secretion-associated protein EspG [Nocardia brasiliensis]|uniref:ESX secretion-associated protein EspG n=1 Tax=Nocardia brasiliensis TaxID=37326 RepID=UPI000B519B1D|nr:ESX secretion-associated protein EspG [Nocardia brasiliensis]ASF10070.1 ESX secretion-associated protein EspG [Nocardia brasiliensis]MBF6125187.1 ESX secretion-associated protein EspG [Nocardia brasiliensis]MBF6545143.1 ESX secretion-associated protein EspG [Nocardia brasiliensis]SUB11511.1 ESX-1 secretion-associated protein EspG1 [Nocardia brasiliensis]